MNKLKNFKKAQKVAAAMIHVKTCPECNRRYQEIQDCFNKNKGAKQ